MFRSTLVPLTAALMNLLCAGAALGVLSAAYVRGWGGSRPRAGTMTATGSRRGGVPWTFRLRLPCLPNDELLPLMRLQYGNYAASLGFAIYLASKDGYKPSALPMVQWQVCPKTRWTAPAASTSTTLPPGPESPTN